MSEEVEEKTKQDIGFNLSVSKKIVRLINRDGSFNVVKMGISKLESKSIYNWLLTMPWWRFNLMVLVMYISINVFFTILYAMIGFEHIAGIIGTSQIEKLMDTFFFSAQTLTTVGYGRMNPTGALASTLAMFESMLGLLGFALATGLLYGKFSRPHAKIAFSDTSIITPFQDKTAWMFRLVNTRDNQLIDVEVQVILSMVKIKNGQEMREFVALELERKKVSFFPSAWTVVHPIDEQSPFFDMGEQEILSSKPEFLIIVKGFDDIFSTSVHTRMSYTHEEMRWDEKFENVHSFDENGKSQVDVGNISKTIKI